MIGSPPAYPTNTQLCAGVHPVAYLGGVKGANAPVATLQGEAP